MVSGSVKIAHMTSVHPRADTRIRLKEVATLAERLDADVRLYVQDGLGDESDVGGYRIIDTGAPLRRVPRMVKGCWRMVSIVRRARPAVAHFHDPELLPWALLLQLSGTKVVYDVHEDVPRQVRHHPSLPIWLRPPLAAAVNLTEWLGARSISAVVAATPEIAARFPSRKTVLVQNYPIVRELFVARQTPMAERPREFGYVGGAGTGRGAIQMIRALNLLAEPAILKIAGTFTVKREQALAEAEPGWSHVRLLGFQGRKEVADLLSRVRAGLVLFQPLPNNIAGRPNKLFEYMSAGLPVIASDYPRWRQIVDGSGCGLLVDPTSPEAIAGAMQWILDNPEEAQQMGERGRHAVLKRYSWSGEAEKLVELYRGLLNAAA